MKLALIGYGKMGKAVEKIALDRGHEISIVISQSNLDSFHFDNLKDCDVAIEFTNPKSALSNILKLCDYGVNIISGSTGWLDHLDVAHKAVLKADIGFLNATNFSLGVNIFFALNAYLAEMMKKHKSYKTSIKEIHHTAKLDAPSGTAITIAESIIDHNQNYNNWSNGDSRHENIIPIISERIDPAPGTHIVTYSSTIDTLQISHEAHNREGFALGAVVAAEWIVNKKGIFSMKDVLSL
jgi:4-hydroxy-tetrahydrodipicolinate reductase